MADREKKSQAKSEGIHVNTNKQPVITEGKVSGSNANINAMYAKMMAARQHGAGKKSNNFKEMKKADIRRKEKN